MISKRKKKKKTKFRLFRRHITRSKIFIEVLASCAVFLIVLYNKTLKVKRHYHPEFLKLDRDKVFYGFWHGRQFLLVPNFNTWNIAIMTDLSWAGAVQTIMLERLGYHVVRGSSRRKGVAALLHTKKAVERGYSAAIALDGPRGPIYQAKPGILFLAQKIGYPIIPVATSADRAWILKKTWCQYFLPKPFSKCTIAFGEPVYISDLNDPASSNELNQILIDWVEKTDRKMGRPAV